MNALLQGIAIGAILATGTGIFLSSCCSATHHDGRDDFTGNAACCLLGLISGLGIGTPVLTLTFPLWTDPEWFAATRLPAGRVLVLARRVHQARVAASRILTLAMVHALGVTSAPAQRQNVADGDAAGLPATVWSSPITRGRTAAGAKVNPR